jgi:hypothetical protein
MEIVVVIVFFTFQIVMAIVFWDFQIVVAIVFFTFQIVMAIVFIIFQIVMAIVFSDENCDGRRFPNAFFKSKRKSDSRGIKPRLSDFQTDALPPELIGTSINFS